MSYEKTYHKAKRKKSIKYIRMYEENAFEIYKFIQHFVPDGRPDHHKTDPRNIFVEYRFNKGEVHLQIDGGPYLGTTKLGDFLVVEGDCVCTMTWKEFSDTFTSLTEDIEKAKKKLEGK